MALLDIAIDVSDAQGTVDWTRVAAAGVKVAMIKTTEGATFRAATWEANRNGAQAAQIRVIPYHFVTDTDPFAQAAHFEAVAELTPGMAYALDWEQRLLRDGTDLTASAAQVEAMGQRLAEMLGRAPIGYWGIPGNTPETPTATMQTWQRWVPRYRIGKISDFTHMPERFQSPGTNFLFWQYTDGGRIDGINGDVDRSVGLFADEAEVFAWFTGGAAPTAVAAARTTAPSAA